MTWGRVVKKEKKDPFSYEVLRKAFGDDIDHPYIKKWWALYREFGSKKVAKNYDFTRHKTISFRFYSTQSSSSSSSSFGPPSPSRHNSMLSSPSNSVDSMMSFASSPQQTDGDGKSDDTMTLTMFYCSRAKPKEYVGSASQVIVPGCIVRLKHQFEVTRPDDSFTLDVVSPATRSLQLVSCLIRTIAYAVL